MENQSPIQNDHHSPNLKGNDVNQFTFHADDLILSTQHEHTYSALSRNIKGVLVSSLHISDARDFHSDCDSCATDDYNYFDVYSNEQSKIPSQINLLEIEEVEAGSWMHSPNTSPGSMNESEADVPNRIQENIHTPNKRHPARKRVRYRTKQQQIDKNIQKYKLLPPCPENCRKKCQSKFGDDHRENIRVYYWKQTFAERRLWLSAHINLQKIKHKKSNGKQVKETNLKYYLGTEHNEKIEVCKRMFLGTLGMRTDGQITEYRKRISPGGLICTADKRCKRTPVNKLDASVQADIVKHIDSYKPQVSHYKLVNSPNRRYLDLNVTVKDMLKDYNKKHEHKISYQVYRNIFKTQNIGRNKPSQDECPTCILGKGHEHDTRAENNECSVCNSLKLHKDIYKDARKCYKEDSLKTVWDAGTCVYAVDMQKVIMLPKMNVKEHFFISRLTVFNETFASLTGKDDLCVMWHEANSGRDASDVTSAYYRVIQRSSDASTFIFWADNCSAQNKNWTLFSGLTSIVNCEHGPEEICIKYFEPGHTYMRADSVHGSIGTAMKREEQILDWDDLTKLVNKSSAKATVVELNEFYKVDDYHRQSTKKLPIPLLKNVRVVMFKKGSTAMHYKERISENIYQSVEFMKAKVRSNMESLWTGRKKDIRGIQSDKKKVIVDKLVPLMPARKRAFWRNMLTNETVPDLVTDRDPGEICDFGNF